MLEDISKRGVNEMMESPLMFLLQFEPKIKQSKQRHTVKYIKEEIKYANKTRTVGKWRRYYDLKAYIHNIQTEKYSKAASWEEPYYSRRCDTSWGAGYKTTESKKTSSNRCPQIEWKINSLICGFLSPFERKWYKQSAVWHCKAEIKVRNGI